MSCTDGIYFKTDNITRILPAIKSILFNVENQDLLKLLYYDDNEPFTQDDIDVQTLAEMLNEINKDGCKLFTVRYNGETLIDGKSQLRIFINRIRPYSEQNKHIGMYALSVQIVVHNNNRLIYGKEGDAQNQLFNRHDYILTNIVDNLNGRDVTGIGNIYIGSNDNVSSVVFKENFLGYDMLFTFKA